MKKIMFLLCFIAILTAMPARAAIIGFEDVPGAVDYTADNLIPNGYYGLDWANLYALDPSQVFPGSGFETGVVVGDWDAFNGFGDPATVSMAGTFNFNGAWFTAGLTDGIVLTLDGYSGGNLMYTATGTLLTTSPLWINANFVGIDTLVLSSFNAGQDPEDLPSGQFAVDQFTVNEPVPEPATMLLFGLGLIGLAGIRRRLMK